MPYDDDEKDQRKKGVLCVGDQPYAPKQYNETIPFAKTSRCLYYKYIPKFSLLN